MRIIGITAPDRVADADAQHLKNKDMTCNSLTGEDFYLEMSNKDKKAIAKMLGDVQKTPNGKK